VWVGGGGGGGGGWGVVCIVWVFIVCVVWVCIVCVVWVCIVCVCACVWLCMYFVCVLNCVYYMYINCSPQAMVVPDHIPLSLHTRHALQLEVTVELTLGW